MHRCLAFLYQVYCTGVVAIVFSNKFYAKHVVKKPMKLQIGFSLLILASAIIFLTAPAMAINATWTYSQKDAQIGSVAISANGEQIAAGAGKIWIFTRDGKLLDKIPYGNFIAMTPDGSTLASSYYSKVCFFEKNSPAAAGSSGLKEVWETDLDRSVHSLALSGTGRILALATDGGGVYFYGSDGTPLGYNKTYASVVSASKYGDLIAGISQQGLATYYNDGAVRGDFDLSIGINPSNMAMTSTGNMLFFNMDQMVRSVYPENGTYIWQERATGSVNSIAITPAGTHIVFGTDNGHVDHFDATGNLTWSYDANPENNLNAQVTSVAISDNGGYILAGTYDGQILALDPTGKLQWSNSTPDHIKHVSVSADGSMAVASGDETIYAFSRIPIIVPRAAAVPLKSATPRLTSVPKVTVPATLQAESPSEPEVTSAAPTPYSVILTQGSPVTPGIVLVAILIIILAGRRT